jgi:hypothetical protein
LIKRSFLQLTPGNIYTVPWHFIVSVILYTIMSESPATTSKDLEGVSEPIENAPQASQAKETKQRKIAVLTSGGDSAGMNAAGTYFLDFELVWVLMISPGGCSTRYRTRMPDIHHSRRMGRISTRKHRRSNSRSYASRTPRCLLRDPSAASQLLIPPTNPANQD